jgi:hypothetical protein
MALSRGRLVNNVTNVSAGSTVGIVTVSGDNNIYVKSILIHNLGLTTTSSVRAHVYYVPNGSSVSTNNQIFNVSIAQSESVLLEPSYPIVLTTTGDTISIGCTVESSTTNNAQINVIINGDKEV